MLGMRGVSVDVVRVKGHPARRLARIAAEFPRSTSPGIVFRPARPAFSRRVDARLALDFA